MDLPVDVGDIDVIAINKHQPADAGAGERLDGERPDTADAKDGDGGVF